MKYFLKSDPGIVAEISLDGDLACVVISGNVTLTTERYVNAFFKRAWDLEPGSRKPKCSQCGDTLLGGNASIRRKDLCRSCSL